MSTLLAGTVLPNSAIVLKTKGEKVLAIFRGEYVVWTIDTKTLATFWGHYFDKQLDSALEHINKFG